MLENSFKNIGLEEFLTRPLFANLATVSELGPRESPVWFVWEEGALWVIGHGTSDSFPGRIKRDSRCAIGIVDFDVKSGTVLHVGMRGRATVESFDLGRAQRLLRRYLGDDDDLWDRRRFIEPFVGEHGHVLIRFVPDDVVARDQSYDRKS